MSTRQNTYGVQMQSHACFAKRLQKRSAEVSLRAVRQNGYHPIPPIIDVMSGKDVGTGGGTYQIALLDQQSFGDESGRTRRLILPAVAKGIPWTTGSYARYQQMPANQSRFSRTRVTR